LVAWTEDRWWKLEGEMEPPTILVPGMNFLGLVRYSSRVSGLQVIAFALFAWV